MKPYGQGKKRHDEEDFRKGKGRGYFGHRSVTPHCDPEEKKYKKRARRDNKEECEENLGE